MVSSTSTDVRCVCGNKLGELVNGEIVQVIRVGKRKDGQPARRRSFCRAVVCEECGHTTELFSAYRLAAATA